MKILRSVLSSNRFLVSSLLSLCLVFVFAEAGSAADQKEKIVIKHGSTVEIWPDTTIPEATESCTPQEFDWWQQIRKANSDLFLGYKKSNKKSILEARARFFQLLYEGQQKAYRVPLKDRPPQMLLIGRLTYPYVARKDKLSGTVEFSVEYRSDGLVGDVQVIKGLGWGLDESVIRAARQNVFLPAIKDGAFVTHQSNGKVEYTRKSNF